MAATAHIAIEQYLESADDERSPEYVDGAIVQRALPSYAHGKTQAGFAAVFQNAGRRHPLFPCTETHLRIGPNLVRIPDVAVFADDEPSERIPSSPPLIVVEVLSPDDAWSNVMRRLEDFHRWGVRHIWLADPATRALYCFDGRDLRIVDRLEIAEYEIDITSDDVFEAPKRSTIPASRPRCRPPRATSTQSRPPSGPRRRR